MPPAVALCLTLAAVVVLFRRDIRAKPHVTAAIWIPLIWTLISGSRLVSQWIYLGGPRQAGFAQEGSPLDRAVLFGLIVAGAYILRRRHVRLLETVRQNRWLAVYLLYACLAVLWADYPLVAFKRWVKTLGEPIMALIIFTEPAPVEALTSLMKRAGYVLLLFSVTLIKYFPSVGRSFSQWTGEAQNHGVADNKNGLGYLCMVFGIFFLWHFMNVWRLERSRARTQELLLTMGLLTSVLWFVLIANAQTALLTLTIGVATLLLLGRNFVSKRFVGTLSLAALLSFAAAEALFGLSANVITLLGRESNLTGRTDLWRDILATEINPIVGAGFESFWLGERMQRLWDLHWWKPTQAHNGYLETYLNLGLIGVTLLLALIIATFWRVRRSLLTDFELGRLRLAFLAALVIYNYTDYAFTAPHLLWFVFFLIAMDYRRPDIAPVQLAVKRRNARQGKRVVAAAVRPTVG